MNKKVCGERPPYSQSGKSYPTCGLTCAGILANRPSRSLGGQNHGGYAAASTWSGSRRGSAPITPNPSTLQNTPRAHTVTTQSPQNGPTPLARSRSQHFTTPRPAAPIARSRSRHSKTPPLQYLPQPPGRILSQSGGYTPQRNANQHMPLTRRNLALQSGGGGHSITVPRNPSQGGIVSQTQDRSSRYSTLPSNNLPCVVSVAQSESIPLLILSILHRCAW